MALIGQDSNKVKSHPASLINTDASLIESFEPIASLADRQLGSDISSSVPWSTTAAPSLNRLTNDQTGRRSWLAAIFPEDSFFPYTFRAVNELRFVKFALVSFVINNLRRRYQRSVLGFAWSLLNPLLMMVVLTTVFSLLFHRDPKTYGIFIFTGMLPWAFISESIGAGCLSITAAEGFMKKVYIPKIFFPLVAVSTECINFALSLVSMLFLAALLGLKITWALLLLPAAMAITFLFVFGIVLALAIATVYFRDLTHLVKVILQSFFYLIPIVYPMSAVPPKYAIFFQANPFSHIVNLFRTIIYYGQCPSLQEWLIPIGLTCTTLTIGFYVLMKREKDIIYRL